MVGIPFLTLPSQCLCALNESLTLSDPLPISLPLSGQRWFRRGDGDDLAVIAVEPHPYAFSLLAYTSHPIMVDNPRSFMFYYPPCRSYNGTKVGL